MLVVAGALVLVVCVISYDGTVQYCAGRWCSTNDVIVGNVYLQYYILLD